MLNKLLERYKRMKVFSNNLKTLNYYAVWLHGLSFIGVLIAFLVKNEEANFNTDLFEFKIESLSNGDKDVKLGTKKTTKITTGMLKAFILLMFGFTAFIHYFYYSDGFGTGAYTDQLNSGKNVYRWIEYAITSTAMVFVLSIISGVKSSDSVFSLCTANMVLMSLGYFVEVAPTKEAKIVGLVVGFFLLSCIWYIILSNFYRRVSEVEKLDNTNKPGEKRKIPSWVKQVLAPMFFWYASFGVVASLYVKNYDKPGFSFETYDRYYIILSYLSKAFMGYYLTFGLTRPKNDQASLKVKFSV